MIGYLAFSVIMTKNDMRAILIIISNSSSQTLLFLLVNDSAVAGMFNLHGACCSACPSSIQVRKSTYIHLLQKCVAKHTSEGGCGFETSQLAHSGVIQCCLWRLRCLQLVWGFRAWKGFRRGSPCPPQKWKLCSAPDNAPTSCRCRSACRSACISACLSTFRASQDVARLVAIVTDADWDHGRGAVGDRPGAAVCEPGVGAQQHCGEGGKGTRCQCLSKM